MEHPVYWQNDKLRKIVLVLFIALGIFIEAVALLVGIPLSAISGKYFEYVNERVTDMYSISELYSYWNAPKPK